MQEPTMEAVVNSTEIRALSTEILFALAEESERAFSGQANNKIKSVGDAIHHLMETSQHRTPKVSLADSARTFWLQPVTFS